MIPPPAECCNFRSDVGRRQYRIAAWPQALKFEANPCPYFMPLTFTHL
jgi:hypothetical protein